MSGATTTAPWPRISATLFAPSVFASACPSGSVLTSMSVSPPAARMSNTGTPAPRNALMWYSGRSGTPLTPNGISDGAWLCTTACTSGRAAYTAAWMNRSLKSVAPGGAVALPSRSCSRMSAGVTSSGARERDMRKCLGSPGTRVLTCPYASSTPRSTRTLFATTRSSTAFARACFGGTAACPAAGGAGALGCCARAGSATAKKIKADRQAGRCRRVVIVGSLRT